MYLAPEVRGIYSANSEPGDEDTFSLAVDIWSVGAIAFQLLTGRLAFPDGRQLFNYVVRDLPFPVEKSLGDECNAFLKATMASSPRNRPNSAQALTHPWIITSASDSAGPAFVPPRPTLWSDPASATRYAKDTKDGTAEKC